LFDLLIQFLNLQKITSIQASENPTFIHGRSGDIIMNGKKVGQIGEIHPEVLGNFGLIYPTAIFEMDLTQLVKNNRIE